MDIYFPVTEKNQESKDANMPEQREDTIFNYWGKADDQYSGEPKWHRIAAIKR